MHYNVQKDNSLFWSEVLRATDFGGVPAKGLLDFELAARLGVSRAEAREIAATLCRVAAISLDYSLRD